MNKSDATTNYKDFLNERLQDPNFKAEYDALEPEFAPIRAALDETAVDTGLFEDIKTGLEEAVAYEKGTLKAKKTVLRVAPTDTLESEFARVPNDETAAAIEEGRRIAKDKSVRGYASVEELKAAMVDDTEV